MWRKEKDRKKGRMKIKPVPTDIFELNCKLLQLNGLFFHFVLEI